MTVETRRCQTLVIGAGPGGYVAAIRLGQLGQETILVEKRQLGGVCLNVGCIPSKALISAAKFYEKISQAQKMGISVHGLTIDPEKLQEWKKSIVKKLTGGVAQLCKGNGVDVLHGTARLMGNREAIVTDRKGKELLIRFENAIIATGSRPIEIPAFPFDGEIVIGSSDALSLSRLPGRLLVIGGGYIGLELGIMYRKLGVEVTIVEMMDQLLPGFDPDLVAVVARKLKRSKVKTFLGARAVGFERTAGGARVRIEHEGKEIELETEKILVTVGRRPNTESLGLEAAGVQRDEKGFIPVDERRATNVPGIYAIGDVAGQPMLAHKASKEGEVAAEVIAGRPSAYDVRTVPAVIFTDPEIATAGLTEPEARAAGYDVITGRFNFAANGRAMTNLETDGFVKVVAQRDTKDILGISIVGPEASDLISEAALAVEMCANVEDVALTIHPHPTLPECLMEAAKAAIGEAIHALK
ncbi:MAG: dihydrolipoyl dehydrogenase [Deltaproteobacteria bacterium]|nr:MAG: dihydrolipoyl dehydrogenase [Deltaproteobacteria bacterium]